MNDFNDFNNERKTKRKGNLALAFIVVIIVFFTLGVLTSAFIITPAVEDKFSNENNKLFNNSEKTPKPTVEKEVIKKKEPTQEPQQQQDEVVTADDYNNPVVGIVQSVGPAVVSVRSDANAMLNFSDESNSSYGSGFIISDEGYIVTNNHVIENGKRFTAIMSDGTEHDAKLIGADPYRDIAVLKIDTPNLTVLAVGDSDAVQVGELAIAIGNPLGLGLGGTVTVGYISAVNRQVEGSEYIQTDAAINPGNSGGPLVNVKGEVIGVNALKNYLAGIDEAGIPIASEGIGFAIPINDAIDVANEIIQTGEYKRPGIGIQFFAITEQVSKEENIPIGAYVAGVVPGGPADKAGMKEEDVIIALNGEKLENPDLLPDMVQALDIGKPADFEVWRNGETLIITIQIGNLNKMD
jgi:serine protease Do